MNRIYLYNISLHIEYFELTNLYPLFKGNLRSILILQGTYQCIDFSALPDAVFVDATGARYARDKAGKLYLLYAVLLTTIRLSFLVAYWQPFSPFERLD